MTETMPTDPHQVLCDWCGVGVGESCVVRARRNPKPRGHCHQARYDLLKLSLGGRSS